MTSALKLLKPPSAPPRSLSSTRGAAPVASPPTTDVMSTTSTFNTVAPSRGGPALVTPETKPPDLLGGELAGIAKSRFGEVNGIQMHWVEAGERKNDNTVVLLHGVPEFWYAWRKQIKPLVDAGYHVVAPDLRGFGKTDHPAVGDVEAYSLQNYARDVAALIKKVGAERAAVVGHDWGGAVAWQVAAQHPDVIQKTVVVNGPSPGIWREDLIEHPEQEQFTKSWYVWAFGRMPWLTDMYMHLTGVESQIKSHLVTNPKTGAKSGISDEEVAVFANELKNGPEGSTRHVMMPYQAALSPGGPLYSPRYPYLSAAVGAFTNFNLNLKSWLGVELPSPAGDPTPSTSIGYVPGPVHLIFGDSDGYLMTKHQTDKALLSKYANPEKLSVKMLPGLSHWAPQESPERVNPELLAALKQP